MTTRDRLQRRAHSRDVPVSTTLADETAAGFERPVDSTQRRIEVGNPVQHGVGEHRVELVLEGQRLRVDRAGIESTRGRGGYEVGCRIDADDAGARLRDLLRQRAV